MPTELVELQGAIHSSAFSAERVWATLLSLATLHDFEECWLLEEGGGDTMVDLAWAWLRAEEGRFPLLQQHTSHLLAEAKKQIKNGWEKDHVRCAVCFSAEHRLAALR